MNELPDRQNGESSHRGGFGDLAGETTGLIDRSFREQIVLVAVQFPGSTSDQIDANLDELAQLVDTAGADPVDRVIQRRDAPDPATYVGKGKVTEIQAASYVLMEWNYVPFRPMFKPAFKVMATITSRPAPNAATADCGHKTLGPDKGLPMTDTLPGLTITRVSAEHTKITWDENKPSCPKRRVVDISRAKKEFGYQAKTSLEEGINKTIDWYIGKNLNLNHNTLS